MDRRNLLRARIAHAAARIMAEDALDDFGLAKRKAARQVGVEDARALPTNEEIEQALREYRQLYQGDAHAEALGHLRREALAEMRRLARFDPHLTGPVLTGLAGKHAAISLQLFADSAKDVELFLLNEGRRYRAAENRLVVNDQERLLPGFVLDGDGAQVRLTVLAPEDRRHRLRTNASGRPIERASLKEVEPLVSG